MLRSNPDLRILVANVEMSPETLLTRQLSRISDVPLTTILKRQAQPSDLRRLEDAAKVLLSISDRLEFAADPHRLDAVAREASDFGADVLTLDYLQ